MGCTKKEWVCPVCLHPVAIGFWLKAVDWKDFEQLLCVNVMCSTSPYYRHKTKAWKPNKELAGVFRTPH